MHLFGPECIVELKARARLKRLCAAGNGLPFTMSMIPDGASEDAGYPSRSAMRGCLRQHSLRRHCITVCNEHPQPPLLQRWPGDGVYVWNPRFVAQSVCEEDYVASVLFPARAAIAMQGKPFTAYSAFHAVQRSRLPAPRVPWGMAQLVFLLMLHTEIFCRSPSTFERVDRLDLNVHVLRQKPERYFQFVLNPDFYKTLL